MYKRQARGHAQGIRAAVRSLDRHFYDCSADLDIALRLYCHRIGRRYGADFGKPGTGVLAAVYDGFLAQRVDGIFGDGGLPADRLSGGVPDVQNEIEYRGARFSAVYPADVDELPAANLCVAGAAGPVSYTHLDVYKRQV